MEPHKVFEAWPSITKEDRKRHPTSKYIIPKQRDVTKENVMHYFSSFGRFYINDDKFHYFIYFEDSFRLPHCDVLYLNNVLLNKYHLTEKSYWQHIDGCNPKFHNLCQCNPDELLEMKMIDSRRVYSMPHVSLQDLPPQYCWEAFKRKIIHSERKQITLLMRRVDYSAYHAQLTLQFIGNNRFPIIDSTSMPNEDTVKIIMRTYSSDDALLCISTQFEYFHFRLD